MPGRSYKTVRGLTRGLMLLNMLNKLDRARLIKRNPVKTLALKGLALNTTLNGGDHWMRVFSANRSSAKFC
ncbi:hypothetical protein O5559_27560, partial [Escherichia coli]|nr:hypothetical protein [Escherichia coli]